MYATFKIKVGDNYLSGMTIIKPPRLYQEECIPGDICLLSCFLDDRFNEGNSEAATLLAKKHWRKIERISLKAFCKKFKEDYFKYRKT
jgi:hypothetical protein